MTLDEEPGERQGIDEDVIACPWCGASQVERLSVFGPRHMVEQWFCRKCRSPFERVRKRG